MLHQSKIEDNHSTDRQHRVDPGSRIDQNLCERDKIAGSMVTSVHNEYTRPAIVRDILVVVRIRW